MPHLTTNGLDFFPMYDAYIYRYHAYVKVEETQSVLNTDELQSLVETAAAASQEDYTAEEWDALQTALSAAQAVLAKGEEATQTEVYEAFKALQAALKTEEPAPGVDKGRPASPLWTAL